MNLHHFLICCHGDCYQAGMRFYVEHHELCLNCLRPLEPPILYGPSLQSPKLHFSCSREKPHQKLIYTKSELGRDQFTFCIIGLSLFCCPVYHKGSPAFTLFRASHHAPEKPMTFIIVPCSRDRIFSIKFFAEFDSKSTI